MSTTDIARVLGERMKAERTLHGITVRQAHEATGISQTIIRRLERGAEARASTFMKLLAIYPDADRELVFAPTGHEGED